MKAYRYRAISRLMWLPLISFMLLACGSGEEEPVPPQASGRGAGGGTASGDTIDLRRIGYSVGPIHAPVTVYEFSDFGCPFCAMFARGTFPQLQEEVVETGQVRWTYVPIVSGKFQNGAESARAAECAGDQQKFWEMHDLLYRKQQEWKGSSNPDELYPQYAAEIGLAADSFASCYRENHGAARTAINNRAAGMLGVRGTPSFYINGRLVEGALPIEQFRQVLTALAAPQ